MLNVSEKRTSQPLLLEKVARKFIDMPFKLEYELFSMFKLIGINMFDFFSHGVHR